MVHSTSLLAEAAAVVGLSASHIDGLAGWRGHDGTTIAHVSWYWAGAEVGGCRQPHPLAA